MGKHGLLTYPRNTHPTVSSAMFNVLRLIIIIATALVVFGWAISAAAPIQTDGSRHRTTPNIILEAMPDIPPEQNERRRRNYRTPFIVPISPPDFGPIELEPKRSPAFTSNRPGWGQPDKTFTPAALATDLDRQITRSREINAHVESLATLPKWASRLAQTNTQPNAASSKHVAVAGPNLRALGERVTLHNLNVWAMEDQLRDQTSWKLSEIESIAKQLASIHGSSQLWTMYWDLLEPSQARRLEKPATLSICVERLRQRIFESSVTLEINHFAVSSLSQAKARSRLNRINDQIQALLIQTKVN